MNSGTKLSGSVDRPLKRNKLQLRVLSSCIITRMERHWDYEVLTKLPQSTFTYHSCGFSNFHNKVPVLSHIDSVLMSGEMLLIEGSSEK